MEKISRGYSLIKRLMDILMAILFMLVLFPVYLVTAIAIWLGDFHSPVYSHIRIGKDKKPFPIIKFRSMVVDADDILFSDAKLLEQMRSGTNKVEEDPRVTKVGKFIRKYSIDEFPQMINVLKGEMSVIGPRALRPDEFENYENKNPKNAEKLDKLTSVKPGITGYWQVSGRSDIDFERRMELVGYYADNISLKLDLEIMLKTPKAMLVGDGAY